MKHILIYSILIISTAAHSIGPCVDIEGKFDFDGGHETCRHAHDNPGECEHETFKTNCPHTCNNCCVDNPGEFHIANRTDDKGKRECSMIAERSHLCNKPEFRHHCPETCKLCPCRDAGGKFENEKKKLVSCFAAKKYAVKCTRHTLLREKCPGE